MLEDKYGQYPLYHRRLWLTFSGSSSHLFFFLCLFFALFSNVFVFSLSNFISTAINIALLVLFSYIVYDLVHVGNPNYNRRGAYSGASGMQGISFDRWV